MAHLLFRTRSLLSYLWHGKSRYHVHSDFVFNFINNVLRSKQQLPAFTTIEQKRKDLLKDQRPVEAATLGAASSPETTVSKKAAQTAINPLYGKLLHRSVAYFGAKNVLEIGSGTGISTLYLASAQGVKHLVSLEGNTSLANVAKEQLQQPGFSHSEILLGNFDSTLSVALGKLSHVDLAFIDGNHQKLPTIEYYEAILPYTHNDSVLVFDDINWSPEMQEAWQAIIARPEVTLSLDLHRLGFVFFRKEFRQPQHLRLYYW